MQPSARQEETGWFEPMAPRAGACAIRLPVFEGPLDLLLHLIRLNELEVSDLPIARIVEQYLEYLDLMRELQLDVAAEYLVMAATLAWIKSRMLLPPDPESEEEEETDPRAELVARLLEYQRFKEAAQALEARPRLERDVFVGRPCVPEPTAEPAREIEVGLAELLDAFRRVMRQTRAGAVVHEVESEPVTVAERMTAILDLFESSETVEISELFCGRDGVMGSRPWIVSTFLAILELARLAALRIYQGISDRGHPQGPIRLRRAREGGDARAAAPIEEPA